MQPLQKITLDRAEFVDQLKTANLQTRLS